MRPLALTLVGSLSLSACAAHVEPKCAEVTARNGSQGTPASRDTENGTHASATAGNATDRLAMAVLGGIPRPTRGQFDTPERVLGFLVQTLASRKIEESLAAFPIIEHAERVTLKDRIEFTYSFSPGLYPLDDDRYARLMDALAGYLSEYRLVALQVYQGDDNARPLPLGSGAVGVLREFDGPPVALTIASIKEVGADSLPQLSSIDRAIGVTEKRAFQVTMKVDQRTVAMSSVVGRVDGDWRVLFVTADFPGE